MLSPWYELPEIPKVEGPFMYVGLNPRCDPKDPQSLLKNAYQSFLEMWLHVDSLLEHSVVLDLASDIGSAEFCFEFDSSGG